MPTIPNWLLLFLPVLLCACSLPDRHMQHQQAHLDSNLLELDVATESGDFFNAQNNRHSFNGNEGIWFKLPVPGLICLGMDYTSFDADVAFLDENQNIVEIQTLRAHGPAGCPHQTIFGMVELAAGWFKNHQILPGTPLKD